MTIPLQYSTTYDLSGGMVTNYNFAKVAKNQVLRILNGDLNTDGSISKRRGRTKLNETVIPGNATVGSLTGVGQNTGADLILAGAAGTIYEISGGAPVVVKTGLNANGVLQSAIYDDFVFYVNGFDQPFMTMGSAATTYQVGINQVTALQFAGFSGTDVAGGDGTVGVHRVAFRYESTITGARSNPYIVSDVIQSITITLGANQTYRVTVGAAMVSTDPQVDRIQYFAQEAGADPDSPYFFLGESANAVGNYDFGTNVSDNDLIVKERLDIDDNIPPATARDIEVWRGRIFLIQNDYAVRYSKIREDDLGIVNLPTSFPETNEIDVGIGDGDKLVKIIKFNDYLFAFKQRSVWLLVGDVDTGTLQFKRLKTNYTNVGLLNVRAIAQAGDRVFFVSDDLKFNFFRVTDFSTEELRLSIPVPSDPINDLFNSFAPAYRNFINLVNYTFAQYNQIWICFSDGSSGLTASQNFNTFVYDYEVNDARGAWSIHTGIEAASSVLAKDSQGDYAVYTGDYYGYVWKNSFANGDGIAINGTSTGLNAANTFNDTTQDFTAPGLSPVGTFITILSGPGEGQIRRIASVVSPTQVTVTPNWSTVPTNLSTYTMGGIDFQVWGRWDWLTEGSPPDFDKYGWYLDMDVETEGNYGFTVYILKDRVGSLANAITRTITVIGSTWGSGPADPFAAIWDIDPWSDTNKNFAQIGFDLLFKQISHRIVNSYAGQFLKVNGWTYCYQLLDHVRKY